MSMTEIQAAADRLTVTMTKEHALAVIHGLEMYQRVSMGAWRYVVEYMSAEHCEWSEQSRADAEQLEAILRTMLTPAMSPNQHKGIGGVSQRAKLTYEVQAQMQQAIAKAENRYGVWNNGALSLTGEPLPESILHALAGQEAPQKP